MKIFNILIICSFVNFSCNSNDIKVSKTINQKLNMDEVDSIFDEFAVIKNSDTMVVDMIYNDEFIGRIIENDLSFQYVKNTIKEKVIYEKTYSNKHYSEIMDTSTFLISGNDTFEFLKTFGKILPVRIIVSSRGFILDKDIKVGDSKISIMNKFKSKFNANRIIVQDIEGGNILTFIFDGDVLTQFNYNAKYID